MAFNPDNNIAKALKQSKIMAADDKVNQREDSDYSDLLSFMPKQKKRKEQVSISLDSEVKEGIEKLAQASGYKHLSSFINDYFANLIAHTKK